ncbi:MAG: DUF2848 domain-containing protein [Acidimicrobiaceae bacterium]|nr:DUF2848 domain-containing protein [Acidimicrobiaceae bacterium]MYF43254.1 DUF2848 domain-containing protein [Acidimicrobiaceae bacterium]MYJ35601.1 DUF2848 domain-containing protein [Acidimicrobiaceae bacterium]
MRRDGLVAVRLEIDGAERLFAPAALVVIGYAGRDRAAVEHHIDELAALGVARPASIPLFMVFPPGLITQEPSIAVTGPNSSGEAEIVVVVDSDETFVTVGSDHTDRDLEAVHMIASKAVCPKPVAASGWAANAVGDRWDGLVLRSHIDGDVLYQDGSAAMNLHPLELVAAIPWAGGPPDCFVAFTGTVPVIGDIRPSTGFRAELDGPGLPPIELSYRVETVPELAV